MQPIFIKFFSSLIVAVPILVLGGWLRAQPSRWPGPDRIVTGQADEVRGGGAARAWRLTAPDRRFGGLSALAVDGDQMVALTDSGVVLRFRPPVDSRQDLKVELHDLPGGPGRALRKAGRDSESLLADPAGRGWWVGFENRHSLWLFDRRFTRVLASRRLNVAWSVNRGAEGLAAVGEKVIVLPEGGGPAVGGKLLVPRGTADATRLPDGRLVLVVRRVGLRGFATTLRIAAGAGRPARRIALDLNPLDNMEGIAAVARRDGGTRLWIVSDDNFRPWMRTVLVALDLPAGT